jgi:excinuclease UvrABC nuclease subunit
MQTCLGPCISACSTEAYFQKVTEARQFLEGHDDAPLALLKERMERCSAMKHYEFAARLRDDLIALCHLKDRLARVRAAQQKYHFIYPIHGGTGETLWYLIRGGRVAAVTRRPANSQESKAVRELVERIFSAGPYADDLSAKRPDTLLLVTNWFQQKPEELEQTLSPREATTLCQKRRRPK